MSPWTILGWILVVVVGAIPALIVLAAIGTIVSWFWNLVINRFKYFMTRNIPPAKGQLWSQDGKLLRINQFYDNGRFSVCIGNCSWGEDAESWKKRVRNRKLFLVRGETN